ncbi:hypothetical protein [Novosphingobium sediminicola]|uniref:DNA-directed RNA polymerase specialized sigma24 family protein n=1 Tax=Novosphingobium sediminicola TaxID=563162 RepID=A0A7W6G8Z2_9SPHN|nr:hypothetical protein [Novosphingobium sediminicola]MBB3957715.1 DNA-directed RNA polymerase specialized sigma24 family protein [Novosphingobium sediminicola]
MNNRSANRHLIAALDRLTMVQRIAYLLNATDGFSLEAIAFRHGGSIREVETAPAGALGKITEGLGEP